jgi:CHAD domain-containing protein
MTPAAIFQREIAIIHDRYAGVLDGEHDSIHRMRIATRRVREVLPLTHEWQHSDRADELRAMVKRMCRSLGRARDSDVRMGLLSHFEARIPGAAPSLVLVRQTEEHRRVDVMRKLVKRFERLGVERELGRQRHASRRWPTSVWPWQHAWRDRLRRHVGERARDAADAMAHATGIYFPNRIHAARIQIKKFRYAAEIAAETALLADAGWLRILKKTQDLLGDLHDRQTLIDDMRRAATHDARLDAGHICLVEQVVEADIADLHARFLKRRPDLRSVCEAIPAAVQRVNRIRSVATIAGALAIATGFEAHRRRRRDERVDPDANGAPIRVVVPLLDPVRQ